MNDYTFYKILDSNGFEPSNENLDILKKGLMEDRIEILSTENLTLSENLDDSFYCQLLENNDFEISEENIKVLKEGLEAGIILLTEESKTEVLKNKLENCKKYLSFLNDDKKRIGKGSNFDSTAEWQEAYDETQKQIENIQKELSENNDENIGDNK